MESSQLNWIANFIWGIADDVLRDLFKRGKYPDVILPMFVLRRMDAVLEPTKKAVLETKEMLDKAGITEQRAALCAAAGEAFYNTSRFALRVIAKTHKPGKVKADPLRGFYPISFASLDGEKAGVRGKQQDAIVEYEPDSDLRDTEQVPLLEDGGIEAFIRREVLPYTPDAWIKEDATKVGYEISFTRHFYRPQPLRTLDEIRADILAVEREAEGLLSEVTGGGSR